MDFAHVKQRIASGSPSAQIALACAAAARVLPVFDTYWDGSHTEAAGKAIEVGWRAATAQAWAVSEADAHAEVLQRFVQYYEEESIEILLHSVSACARVLECLRAHDDAARVLASARACGSQLYVGVLADLCIAGQPSAGQGPAQSEEAKWQEAALACTQQWQGLAITSMFDACGPTPPAWWPLYVNAPRHI